MTTHYMTVDQAADYLNVSVRFVRRLVAERRVPFHKAGALVRFAATDLDAFMLAGRVEPITSASVRRDLGKVA
jgi:excisionase family DNA binding protein